MLFKHIKKISPALVAFAEKTTPHLMDEEVELYKPASIPKSRSFVGRAFLFSYRNPKGKGSKDLPYFHICPLVILLEQASDHILGLNLFYLNPAQRGELFHALQNTMTGYTKDPETRARITYKIIDKYRVKYKTAFPCIKKYLHTRMGNVVVGLKPELWKEFYLGDNSKKHENLFSGRGASTVWSESFSQIKNNTRRKKK